MKKTLGILSVLIIAITAQAKWGDPLPPGLIGLLQESHDKSICRCEYYQSPNYGQLVLMRSCDRNAPRHAHMKIDGNPIVLTLVQSNIESGCKPGAPFKEVWSSTGILVNFEGTIKGPGEESCHVKGSLTVEKGEKKQVMPVEGACGI